MATTATPISRVTFRNAMGKYCEDHITWTRLYIIAALSDSPDLPETTQRLLQNQVDIGNAIRPFYGDAAADRLTALLREHILIAADVVASAKANDPAGLDANMQRWQANADEIGDFLGAANPRQWPPATMKSMMRQHLDLTTQEVVARLHHDWSGDIAAYDRVHLHILVLADVLTNGIEAQFPAAFDGAPDVVAQHEGM
ncbi:MAG TPA: glycosyltransferase [Chloroflexota bacterium]